MSVIPNQPEPICETLLRQSIAMAQHSSDSGLAVPAPLLTQLQILQSKFSSSLLDQEEIYSLAALHQHLTRVIAPATPRTIMLLAKEQYQNPYLVRLGPVPLIRNMMAFALVSIVGLLATGMAPQVNSHNISDGFFASSGLTLILCQCFLLCAAGLGACFANLFRANRYIGKHQYDPKYDSSYWTHLILGLMAGMMLAEFVPIDSVQNEATTSSGLSAFAKPTLAMLGGFSATVVYRILNRLIHAIESLVNGDAEATRELAIQARKSEIEALELNRKNQLISELVVLDGKIRNLIPEKQRDEWSNLLGRYLSPIESATYPPNSISKTNDPHDPQSSKAA